MDLALVIIGLLTLAGAVAAMTLRNLVHCALCLAVALVGIALLYLKLGAQFVGLAQVLVYVGAVAILVVFAILLTRGGDAPQATLGNTSWRIGVGVAVLAAGSLLLAVWTSAALDLRYRQPAQWVEQPSGGVRPVSPPAPEAPVRRIGERLMRDFVLPLEAVALLLTVALVGGVIISMRDKPSNGPRPDAEARREAIGQPGDGSDAPSPRLPA